MIKDNFDRESYKPAKIPYQYLVDSKLFLKKHAGIQIIDQFTDLLEELFLLRNPRFRFNKNYQNEFNLFIQKYKRGLPLESKGNWFYFPWSNLLIHYLPENEHLEVRTGRNRNLITETEQKNYYNSCVAIFGMSVGSHVAMTMAMTGGCKNFKLADLDIISGSNLNRIRVGFSMVGLSKVKAVARQIFEINPYAKVDIFTDGVNEKNLSKILSGGCKPNLLVEEMDNPYFKVRARELSRPLAIPVIMAADNGDGVIIDVERYDLNKKTPILHDIIANIKSNVFKNVAPEDLPQIIARIAGAQYAPKRMLESVGEVGKTLYSWPQLGTAATLCGSVLANLGRRIILKENIPTGRFVVDEKEMYKKVI